LLVGGKDKRQTLLRVLYQQFLYFFFTKFFQEFVIFPFFKAVFVQQFSTFGAEFILFFLGGGL